jgi:hypothetical protein
VTIATTVAGLRRAARLPRLVALLWLVNLSLAAAAAIPGWLALRSAIGMLPQADRLRDGFSFLVLSNLVQLRPGLLGGLLLSALGLGGLGLLVGNLVVGGLLEVLLGHAGRPLGERFGRGAFGFFGRFLRVGLGGLALGAVALVLALSPFALVARRAATSAWEPAGFVNVAAGALVAFAVVLLVLMALDAARILIVRDGVRRAWPALRDGGRAVLRHPAQWLALWLANGLLVAAAFAVFLALRGALPAAPLLATVALQQAFVLTRCALRVALVGGEIALLERLAPPAQVRGGPEAAEAAAPEAPFSTSIETEPPPANRAT